MEDIDELRRALEAANMRAAAAEAVAGQAEARVAEVEDELRRLQAQRQAERGVNPNAPKPKPPEGPHGGSLSAYGIQLERYERDLMRRLMMDTPPVYNILDEYIAFTDRPPRPTRGRLARYGGSGVRRVTMHYQTNNGAVMLRAETGNFDMAADSAEYICLQIDRYEKPTDTEVKVVKFVQELDRVKRVDRPTQAIKDIMNGISHTRSGKDYTVVIE